MTKTMTKPIQKTAPKKKKEKTEIILLKIYITNVKRGNSMSTAFS